MGIHVFRDSRTCRCGRLILNSPPPGPAWSNYVLALCHESIQHTSPSPRGAYTHSLSVRRHILTVTAVMARPRNIPSQTIVIKLGESSSVHVACRVTAVGSCAYCYYPGSSSIVHETTHQPLLSTLSAVVETVVHLREQGHKVVLVSSGAIAVGLKRMEVPSRPKGLSKKQVRIINPSSVFSLTENS